MALVAVESVIADATGNGVITTPTADNVIAESSIDGVGATRERVGWIAEVIVLEIGFNIELKAEISVGFFPVKIGVRALGVVETGVAEISKLS